MPAHREELIGQAAEKILAINLAASIGIIKADRNETHRQIVVASVQTLARVSRLSRIDTTYKYKRGSRNEEKEPAS